MAVAEARRNFQAQLDQTRAESQHRDAKAQQKMNEIAVNLANLTDQLNKFKPASVAEVSRSQKLLSSAVEEKINLQAARLDTVSETANESQKAALETSELLQNLLVGMENLGDNVKQLREEVNAWGEPESQEILDELMKEVPIVSSASEQPQVSNQPPTVTLQIPPTNDPILSSPASGSTPIRNDPELEEMQK